jgi:transposase
MSRNTIFKYNDLLKKHPLSQKELANLSDKELYSIVYPPAVEKQAHEVLYGLFPEMDVKLSRVGVTKLMLWEQYKQNHPEGLQYSRFCEHYKRYEKSQQNLIDKETGEAIPVEFFVAILPCSKYTYAEACLSQQTPDFLHCLGNALSWFGGVPEAIVTDNLKPSVNKARGYDPEINHSMSDFADHYDTVVLPTRVKKPKDKALVESVVNILYTRIYAPLHDRVFHTLQELNDAVTELLCKHNHQYFQGKTISRKQQFDTLERNVLKPLPTIAFEQKTYSQAKVHPNCHVMLGKDKHHNSVPYQYIGKKVEIG